ncbi:hypothetical protein M885DRAFT_562235 [Pelagophyceae sp. CCMP2097]|nr:hypothetical protein M885DRAFT_562235 [Pelagophyceae sp. CCMP2097]
MVAELRLNLFTEYQAQYQLVAEVAKKTYAEKTFAALVLGLLLSPDAATDPKVILQSMESRRPFDCQWELAENKRLKRQFGAHWYHAVKFFIILELKAFEDPTAPSLKMESLQEFHDHWMSFMTDNGAKTSYGVIDYLYAEWDTAEAGFKGFAAGRPSFILPQIPKSRPRPPKRTGAEVADLENTTHPATKRNPQAAAGSAKSLEVLPSDDATFEPSQAPLSGAERKRMERATTMAKRGVHVGIRVCLASDSVRRGVVESQGVGGWWVVRFADKSRNIHIMDLEVLSSDDATFEPSQAPLNKAEKRATTTAARAVQVGVRVCLASDSARRGVVESHVYRGYWAVQFADTSRNIRVYDLEVLPSDDKTFEPSQAPPNTKEREKEKRPSSADRALKAATPPAAASSRNRRAETSDDAGAAAATEASAGGEEHWHGDGASGDEPRAKRLRDLDALESAPLFSSLDGANREIARLWALGSGALVETIDVDTDGAVDAAAEAAARRRAMAAPASGLAALASLHASHETIVVAIKEERDTVTEERDKVTMDRDDHEDECLTAYKFIEQQKDVISGLKEKNSGLRREIDGLRREAQRRDEAGARRVAVLEAAAIEAPPPPTKRRARPRLTRGSDRHKAQCKQLTAALQDRMLDELNPEKLQIKDEPAILKDAAPVDGSTTAVAPPTSAVAPPAVDAVSVLSLLQSDVATCILRLAARLDALLVTKRVARTARAVAPPVRRLIWQDRIGHTDVVTGCAFKFSPDGKRIITASMEKTAQVWDAETGAVLTTLRGHTGFVYSGAFSPGAKRVVTASEDCTARLSDAETGALLVTLKGHPGGVRSCAFSPDGKRIVTARA